MNFQLKCHTFICSLDCIDKQFGKGTFSTNKISIVRKCNQKCSDVQKRIKKPRLQQIKQN